MRKDNNHQTVGLGIPTILMVFVVLGMVILSTLTYLNQDNNCKIVEREVEYTKNYYKADSDAKHIIALKDMNYISQKCDNYSYENGILKFIINIDKKHELIVTLYNDIVTEYYVNSREVE